MPEEDIIGELEELSQMVEGGEDIEKGLQEIEKITKEAEPKETSEEKPKAESSSKAPAEKSEKKEVKKEEKKEEKHEKKEPKKEEKSVKKEEKTEKKEVKKEVKPEKKEIPRAKPPVSPEKAIKSGLGFKVASALLIIVGFVIYILAYYLRWTGWHLISNPPSSAVALGGTVLIIAGGELYYRGKER